ncbi:telomerase reverse transcriptase-like [Gigantopelta aegis]|uniref:telomerase reverse transcriptase-like n=1 Tax=Gigantopelta aegis TaxID=1735272 RepID=UPI001B88CD67|nr:telomerase reverse transcriptase-like [Gigantopelta aegis]
MTGIKVKPCKWLPFEVGQSAKVQKLAQLIWWLFNNFIMALLKAYFYITDTTLYRNRLFYYRKKIWHQLHTRAFQDLIQKKMLQTVSETRVMELLKTESSLGVSYLRFLPKSGSLRPIINLGRRPLCGTRKTLSINQQLMTLLHVLKFHVNADPSIVGSSLFGLDDTYKAWVKFIAHRSLNNDHRLLYFVKTDIAGCFDTIRQEKLYSIVSDILKKNITEEYVTRRFASVVVAGGRLKRTFHRDSNTLFTYQPDFFVFNKKRMLADNLRNIILVDQVVNQHDTVDSLLKTLQAHLFNNIIKVGRRFYLQRVGISQGSILSTMLCNLYYGHKERWTMDVAEDELLLRMVDDFLFVTPYKDKAEQFLEDMLKGNEEYNCKTNVSKVLTNFPVSDFKDGMIPCISRTEPLPWCGLLINTNTLEVSVDYSRYAGLRISDTMTFDLAHQPGLAMKNKLLQSLRPKCHGIFFDSQINSQQIIIVNIYKLMLLMAHKFHAYMMHFPASRRASSNVQFFHDMILTLSSHLYSQSTEKTCSNPKGQNKKLFPLSLDVVKWLTLKAFVSKLKQHHSIYRLLLASLQDVKRGLHKSLKHTMRHILHQLTTSEGIRELNQILLKGCR